MPGDVVRPSPGGGHQNRPAPRPKLIAARCRSPHSPARAAPSGAAPRGPQADGVTEGTTDVQEQTLKALKEEGGDRVVLGFRPEDVTVVGIAFSSDRETER
ncbi:hypothetical protein [Nonomuraea glycinis]|uniref:hypothetical protein n=1 Tax=Nonomuraea glycinis TaxID=2047744 RepID=UPI002E1274A2|nr:hypothetical protein OHA68_41930 [Nonomuraea glycinis]